MILLGGFTQLFAYVTMDQTYQVYRHVHTLHMKPPFWTLSRPDHRRRLHDIVTPQCVKPGKSYAHGNHIDGQ